MKHPPYHLRLNKMVDRLLLIDVIRRVADRAGGLSEYTYYSLGGPYLEDFRLLYDLCPEIGMVSLERDEETFKRQKFNLPCGSIALQNTDFKSFISTYDEGDKPAVFWLDYTGLRFSMFEDFQAVLDRAAPESLVKITLKAAPLDVDGKWDNFRATFDAVLPEGDEAPVTVEHFSNFVQRMVRIAAERALPATAGWRFQPLCSFRYADGVPMVTVTGLVCSDDEVPAVKTKFDGWEFANLNWSPPTWIDLPELSTKERLALAPHLPQVHSGAALVKTLGYLIDRDQQKSEGKMEQYAMFHRYFPHFVRATV